MSNRCSRLNRQVIHNEVDLTAIRDSIVSARYLLVNDCSYSWDDYKQRPSMYSDPLCNKAVVKQCHIIMGTTFVKQYIHTVKPPWMFKKIWNVIPQMSVLSDLIWQIDGPSSIIDLIPLNCNANNLATTHDSGFTLTIIARFHMILSLIYISGEILFYVPRWAKYPTNCIRVSHFSYTINNYIEDIT